VHAGVLNPTKSVAMFQSLAARHGAVIRDHMEVTGIKKEVESDAVQVLTASGDVFYGKKVIITAGAWTRNLVQSASGIELPIEPVHTLICYWKIREGCEGELTPAAGFPTFASYGEPYIYGTPCLEYPNLIKIAMHGGIPCNPDRRDWQVGNSAAASADEPKVNALVGPVAQWISKFMPEHVEANNGPVMTQACMYSMTPDGDFIIDFLGGVFGKDVVVAGGFSGHGFKMGPAVGKILAEMAVQGEAVVPEGVDMGMFSIARFQNNPSGNAKLHAAQVSLHKT
jgi:sarcosine oxidase / L-pipecolate oxidase